MRPSIVAADMPGRGVGAGHAPDSVSAASVTPTMAERRRAAGIPGACSKSGPVGLCTQARFTLDRQQALATGENRIANRATIVGRRRVPVLGEETGEHLVGRVPDLERDLGDGKVCRFEKLARSL